MKNKGFTLIELLAVIVILAIIALIATPIILGIINDARNEAKKRSAELAYSGVEYAITTYMYKNSGDIPTSLEDISKNFKAENVYMDTDGKIYENSEKNKTENKKELCTVAEKKATDGKTVTGFTVTCENLMDTKTITLGATEASAE